MYVDVVDLRDFYQAPLGMMTRRLLRRIIRREWPDTRNETIAGYGFATPYLRPFKEEAERLMALMPAQQGVVFWPPEGPYCTTLVGDMDLPLPDQCVHRVLAVHAIEMSPTPNDALREIWRILVDGGRFMVVVPNRRGLWARFDHTPFGHGHPFSRSQLERLLKETGFTPESCHEALYMPPVSKRIVLRSAAAFESMGPALRSAFAGVHIVEAKKEMLQPVTVKKTSRIAIQMRPSLAPASANSVLPAEHKHRL